ncbi:Syntaxin-16 [Desmophyllum pertusum]|uniref:Syntaxin-16 n=1 Tax=Desmophyllum pertusum TaxID=174260 RepID=A0A9X0CF99_9CNID|nr:Syntaxin-16 [Desmophyllum pertusum]
MATRNLTEIYINLRTEISRFKAYSLGDSGVRSDSPGDDDTVALVRRTSDLELGVQAGGLGSLPPQWVDVVEEIQFENY